MIDQLKAIQIDPHRGSYCILVRPNNDPGTWFCIGTGYDSAGEAKHMLYLVQPSNTTARIEYFGFDNTWHGTGKLYGKESTRTPMKKVKVTVYKQFDNGFIESLETAIVDEEGAGNTSMKLLKKHPGDKINVMCEYIVVNDPPAKHQRRPINYAVLPIVLQNVDASKDYPFEVIVSNGLVRIQSTDLKKEIYIEALIRNGNLEIDYGSWDQTGADQQTAYAVLNFEEMLGDLLPF